MYPTTAGAFDWLTLNAPYPVCQAKVARRRVSCAYNDELLLSTRLVNVWAIVCRPSGAGDNTYQLSDPMTPWAILCRPSGPTMPKLSKMWKLPSHGYTVG